MDSSVLGPTASSSSNPPPNDGNSSTTKPVKNKRTKTGCLTCRKRRIKCDEGRPNCNNCTKSKKECKYSTFTFRQQTGFVRDSFHENADSRLGHIGGGRRGQYPRPAARAALTPIAPRPPNMTAERANEIAQYGPPRPLYTTQEHMTPQSVVENMTFGFSSSTHQIGPARLLPNPLHNPAYRMQPDGQNATFGNLFPQPSFLQLNQGVQHTGMHGYVAPAPSTSEGMSGLDSDFDESLDDSDYEMEHVAGKPVTVSSGTPLPRPKPAGSRSAPGIPKSNALFAYMDYPRDSDGRTEGMKVMLSHFINITSPTITLYERHSESTSGKETQDQRTELMRDGRRFWSYILPVLSLHHPGLLQAMLALANVQVANVQDAYPTVAMKHYHLAIQRLRQNISSPRKTQIATLATALLLAYFEVWTSDHSRWCKHLLGARFILLDIPLRQMTKKCWHARAWRRQRPENELDMDLLSRITGYAVDYGIRRPSVDYGVPTEQDVRQYENYADLYWWYCKMDVYQSILSGRPLLMHYPAWTQCPPRAAVNMPNDVYGSYDHLVLLLGRVADFTVRDKKRKAESWKLKRRTSPGSKESPNQYPGILPTTGFIPTPAGFDTSRSRRTEPRVDATNHFESLDEAMAQWEEIKEAFSYLKSKLWISGFRPLSVEYADSRDTPFGAGIQHGSYAISGFWMNYYMGLICLQRAHPSMPPAPLEAVGMAARDTAKWATKIARIAIGMMEDPSKLEDIRTVYAASLIESTFCLFVAGVQFQDAAQRNWLVRRMDDTSRLTGFLSARHVADGCETGWQKTDTIRQVTVYQKRQDRRQGGSEIRRRSRLEIERRPVPKAEMLLLESADQAFFALGLLTVTEDFEKVVLTDDLPNQG